MLQSIRKQKGLSQSELAQQSGVNVSMIQFYEQGVKNIDGAYIGTLCDIADTLGCKIWDILVNEELREKVKRNCTNAELVE